MIEVVIFVVIAVALLTTMFWLLRKPVTSPIPAPREPKLQIEDLFPLHCRYFPQVRQALSAGDEEYLRRRANGQLRRRWRAERRQATHQFVAGLWDDFSRLNRLARAVALLSPKISQAREAEHFWLSLRFRLLYALVSLRLATGSVPLPQLTRLADLVGSLAAQIETGTAALAETSVSRLRTDFGG